MNNKILKAMTPKERKDLRDKKIRDMNKLGYTMDQICRFLSVSKTTVFFAINKSNRSKKRAAVKKLKTKLK